MYIYLLKVNAALLVFWLFYRLVFGGDTFLGMKRFCLLLLFALSFLYPWFGLPDWMGRGQQGVVVRYVADWQQAVFPVVSARVPSVPVSYFTWERALWLLYSVVALFLLVRTVVRLSTVFRFARRGKRIDCSGTPVISPGEGTAPFSFFKWIFLHPDDHTPREIQEILAHEKAHAGQWHSLDMMAGEVMCILFWFNPAVWLLRREIRQNLEFLADKNVVEAGYCRKNYQYHLLRLSHSTTNMQIVNNFNVSQLKKRIMMMNKQKTSRIGLLKYLLLLPLTFVLVATGNVQALSGLEGRPARLTLSRIAKMDAVLQAGREMEPRSVPQVSAAEARKTRETLVRGKVEDTSGKPLSGAAVVVKGTDYGTASDRDGNFSLKLPGGEKATLVVSYVGMVPAEVTLTLRNKEENVSVRLEPGVTVMDDIVVIKSISGPGGDANGNDFIQVEVMPEYPGGTEALKKFIGDNLQLPDGMDLTGVADKIYISFTIDEQGKVVAPRVVEGGSPSLNGEVIRVIQSMPAWSPARQRGVPVATQYMLPVDLRIDPSGASSCLLKGEAAQRTLSREEAFPKKTMDGKPLILVDGVAMPEDYDLNALDIETVESVTVLKDKEALKAYGSAAENGVILIRTKR